MKDVAIRTITRIGILGVLAVGAMAQVSPAPSSLKGSVSGRVSDADTQIPLSGVRVGSRSLGWAITDSDGSYILREVPQGRQTLTVADQGYLYQSLTIPIAVDVVPQRETKGANLRVRLEAAIAGRVVDDQNSPVSGARVVLIGREYGHGINDGSEYSNGELWYEQKASAMTDDRGRYTISGVLAGRRYWVMAYPAFPHSSAEAPANVQSREPALAPTYYPSAAFLESSVPLVLRSLERRENIDIQMKTSPSYCVEGILRAEDGTGPLRFILEEEAIYRLVRPSTTQSHRTGESGADGRMRVCGLTSGRYRLIAYRPALSANLPAANGSKLLAISDEDISGVELLASAPASFSGEIVLDAPPGTTFSETVRIGLTGPVGDRSNIVQTKVPSEFSLSQAPSPQSVDRNSLTIFGVLPPFYVKDIEYDGASILKRSLSSGPGLGKLRITIGSDTAAIAVRVADGVGTTHGYHAVFILPASAEGEPELATTLHAGVTNQDSLYLASGLGPGEYFVLATDNPPPSVRNLPSGRLYVEKTPETLQLLLRARSKGSLVRIKSGARAEITVVTQPIH